MKCVLHIGTEKTGTTFLQHWLYSNEQVLSQQGICLSAFLGERNSNRLFPVYFADGLDEWTKRYCRVSSPEEKDKYFESFEERLSREFEAASHEHEYFIITSEFLHSRIRSREEMTKIKEFLSKSFSEILVVCYFRNQADMVVSLYSTAVKGQYTGSLEEFVRTQINRDSYYFNFKEIADNWASVFGQKNCRFRIFDQKRFAKEDVRIDFLNAFGASVDLEKLNFTVESKNEALSPSLARAYRYTNRFIPIRKGDGLMRQLRYLNRKVKKLLASLPYLKSGKIVHTNKDEIQERFSKTNAEFFEEYFGSHDRF